MAAQCPGLQAQVAHLDHGHGATLHAELAVQRRQHVAHGLLGQSESRGDLQVVKTLPDQGCQLTFSRRKRRCCGLVREKFGDELAQPLERRLGLQWNVVARLQHLEAGIRNLRCKLAPSGQRHGQVAFAMQHQGRHP